MVGAETVDVGPPQTQVSGTCRRLLTKRDPEPIVERTVGYVKITFLGAANAQFTEAIPTNGKNIRISMCYFAMNSGEDERRLTDIANPLSISHIESHTKGVNCVFNGIDHGVTRVHGAELVDVGPPQTQVSGHCKAV